MNPESPPRVRRSSILKAPRPAASRSPLQCLEANQTAFDTLQDEDRTTVTRTTFKRRVSFSRTNRVQEFCLENPQAPVHHIWGPAYEKELSPEPSPLISRDILCLSNPVDPSSSFQNLLSSEIKTCAVSTFTCSSREETSKSAFTQQSSLDFRSSSSAYYEPLWSQQQQQPLPPPKQQTVDDDDDMDITGQNLVPTSFPSSLAVDKENLQRNDRSDFMSRILQQHTDISTLNRSTVPTSTLGINPTVGTTFNMNPSTLVDMKASFPNVRFESEEEEIEELPKQSSVQNMLNQTCINDSSMDMSMSTCSVVEDPNLSELSDLELENATKGNKDLLDKSLRFLEKTTGAMDITQHLANENISYAPPSVGISRNVGTSNLPSFLNSNEHSVNKIPSTKSPQVVPNTSSCMELTMDKGFKNNSDGTTYEQSLLGFSASELAASDSTSYTKTHAPMDSSKMEMNTTKLNPSFMNLTQTSSLLNASKSLGSQTMDFTQLDKSRVNPSFNSTRSADSQSMELTRLDKTHSHPLSFLSKTCGNQSMDLTQSVKPDCNSLEASKSFGSQTMDFTQLDKSRASQKSDQSMDLTRLEKTQSHSFMFSTDENYGSQTMNFTQGNDKAHSLLFVSQSPISKDLGITYKDTEHTSLQNRKKLDIMGDQVDMDFTKIDSPNDDTLSLLNVPFGIPVTNSSAGSNYWLGMKTEATEQSATSVLTSQSTQDNTEECQNMDTTMEMVDEPINFMSSTLNKSTAPRSLLASQELEVIKPVATQPQIESKNDILCDFNNTNDMDITYEPQKLNSSADGLFTPPKRSVLENFQMPKQVLEMDITRTADEPSNVSPVNTKESIEENVTSESHDMDITRLPKPDEMEDHPTTPKMVFPNVASPNIATKPTEAPSQNLNVSIDCQSKFNVVDITEGPECHEVVSTDCNVDVIASFSSASIEKPHKHDESPGNVPQSDVEESPISVVETANDMDITALASTESECDLLLSPTKDKDMIVNSAQNCKNEMDITKAGDLLPVKALNKTTCLDSLDIEEHSCHTPSPVSQEIISECHLTESPDMGIIKHATPESARVSTDATNVTSVLQSSKINASGVTENNVLCTENKETKLIEISSSESNKTIMVEKLTVDDRIANEKCEIENCEISEHVRTPSLSESTEVEATKIHITEDFEDVQVNEQTGEISRQIKHFDFKETIESLPSEVFTPPLPSTQVNLNVSEELFLSPKQDRNSNIAATVVARQGNDSQQNSSDTKFLQPESKSIGGEKRGSEWLEQEAVSNKKSCQKFMHVPEIIITAPTPPQIHSQDSQSPSTNQNHAESDTDELLAFDPKSEMMELSVPKSDLVSQEPVPSIVHQESCPQVADLVSQEICSSPENTKLYSQETDLASQDMHLGSGETNLCSQVSDLVSQDMCSSPEDMKLYSQETDLASQDMHLSSGETNLCSQETDLISQDICSSPENTKLYSQETDFVSQDMHLSSTEVNLLSQETQSSQEMECVIPEVVDKVTSYPTKRKSDEPLNALSNKHFKYFEQAMSSYSGDFPNESLSLLSEAIHTLYVPAQMQEEYLAPITLEDFIKEMSQSERKTWRILSLQSSHWRFGILHGTAVLSLNVSPNGNITEAALLPNSDVLDKLPRTHQTVWQFCLKQLETKFPSSTIENHCIEAASVPDLMNKLAPTLNSLTCLGRGLVQATSFCVLKFYGNSVQFSLWSFKMRLLVKVKLDLSDWENLSTDHITINLIHGNVKTEDLKGLVNSAPRAWNLVPSFIQNIREYIQTLDDFCFTFPRALRHSSR